jgi:hypothetical protein
MRLANFHSMLHKTNHIALKVRLLPLLEDKN